MDVVAAVGGREHVLGAALGPLHRRAAEGLRDPDRDVLLGVGVEFRAEAAAHVGRDHAHLRLAGAVHDGDERLHEVRHLRGGIEGHLTVRGHPLGDDAARLDRDRREPLVHDPLLDHDLCIPDRIGEALGLVLDRAVEVARCLVVHLRRPVGDCRFQAGNGRKRLVVDFDGRGTVGRRVPILGDDHGDWLSDHPHLAAGEHRALDLLPLAGRVRGARDSPLDPKGLGGKNCRHARKLQRAFRVDGADLGVRMGTADETEVVHAGKHDVVDEAPLAGDELGVLLAERAGADPATRVGRRLLGFRELDLHRLEALGVALLADVRLIFWPRNRLAHALTSAPAAAFTASTMLW